MILMRQSQGPAPKQIKLMVEQLNSLSLEIKSHRVGNPGAKLHQERGLLEPSQLIAS